MGKIISLPLFMLLLCLCLSSCEWDDPSNMNNTSKPAERFFDIKVYIDQEAKRLKSVGVRKVVCFNSRCEESSSEHLDFAAELAAFYNSDINRPAWAGKYSIDSTFNSEKRLVKVFYKSIDRRLRTQSVEVGFSGSRVVNIGIVNESESLIANSKQELLYRPDIGYSIKSYQKMIWSNEIVLQSEVFF